MSQRVPPETYVEQERKARESLDERTRELCKMISFIDPTAKIRFTHDEIVIECREETRAFIVAELCK